MENQAETQKLLMAALKLSVTERYRLAFLIAESLGYALTRFVNCDVCQTEGRIYTSNGGPDEIDNGPCPACKGERMVEVETKPCDFLTECPSCKQMYENGGQCAAPVMRGGCPMGGDF